MAKKSKRYFLFVLLLLALLAFNIAPGFSGAGVHAGREGQSTTQMAPSSTDAHQVHSQITFINKYNAILSGFSSEANRAVPSALGSNWGFTSEAAVPYALLPLLCLLAACILYHRTRQQGHQKQLAKEHAWATA